MRWLRQWGPVIASGAVIAIFSTEYFSSSATSRFILPFLQWLFPRASFATIELLHVLVRKAAHFTEYFVFSLLVLRGIRGERVGWIFTWGMAAVLIAVGYAALDEVHQAFVPGRTGSPWDVLLDSSGAAGAQLLAWLRAR